MLKVVKRSPKEIAETILARSPCAVQVGACLSDGHGVFSWGWNSSGADGLGMHAERHCLGRAGFPRSIGATLWVAARRRKNHRVVTAKPCEECQKGIFNRGILVWYRDGDGVWRRL